MHFEETADSDTVSTYQVSSVQFFLCFILPITADES